MFSASRSIDRVTRGTRLLQSQSVYFTIYRPVVVRKRVFGSETSRVMVRLGPRFFFPFLNLPPCCCISFGPATPLSYGPRDCVRKFSNVLRPMRNLSERYSFKSE